jgi:hypothetical protein
MAASEYHFVTRWRLEANIEEVQTILHDAEELARWWPSVYLEVKIEEPGDPATGIGRLVALYTKGWRISADKPLLKYLSFLMKPLFSANHVWAMARGEESLRLELARRHAANDDQRSQLAAPPPPTLRWAIKK